MTVLGGYQDGRTGPHITTLGIYGKILKSFHSGANPASTAWPANNRAYLMPFLIDVPTLIVEMFFVAGTTPGTANFDLGIYRDDFTRIVSLGATAAVNTTDAVQPVGGGDIADTVLGPGRYYMAMSAAATTITVRANTQANQIMRALGLQMMESAHPLPATVTPISVGTSAFLPYVGMSTVTNIL